MRNNLTKILINMKIKIDIDPIISNYQFKTIAQIF